MESKKKKQKKIVPPLETDMAKSTLLFVLKALMALIFAAWISLWLLKPTQLWTEKWKGAEDAARNTVFGYYGTYFRFQLNKRNDKHMLLFSSYTPLFIYSNIKLNKLN